MHVLRKPLFYVIVVLLMCIVVAFSNFIAHPNAYLLTNSGDGYKNYFTPAWYAVYDSGTHFSGMLYPYGDNLIYADAQPALSWSIKLLSHIFPDIVFHTVAIIHFCIFFSILMCGVFLYLVLIRYVENKWVAAIAAIGITLLSPQLERLNGHFALSYICVIPCLWYLHIRWMETGQNIRSIVRLIFVVTLFSFMHLYFLLTALLFFTAFLIVYAVCGKLQWKILLQHIIVLAVPAIISLGYIHLTDTITDRPDTPFGFTIYRTTLGSLLSPDYGNFYDFWIDYIGLQKSDMEGYAYIGLISVIAILFTGIYFISKIPFSLKEASLKFHLPGDLLMYTLSAVLILCFALAWPFIWGFEEFIEKIPFIKQFRSPGRFAWIFYYVINVYAVYLFYNIFVRIKTKSKIFAGAFIFCVLTIMQIDGFTYFFNEAKSYNVQLITNTLNDKVNIENGIVPLNQIDPDDFQAILFVPLFMQGSEKIYIDGSNGDFAKAMEISFKTGLPLIDAMMSRTSLSQTLELTSLVSNPHLEKEISKSFNEKPLLLVTNNNQLSIADKYLIAQADSICSRYNLTYYALPLSAFTNNIEDAIAKYSAIRNTYQIDSGDLYISELPLAFFYKNEFENLHASKIYSGEGALQHKTGGFYMDEIALPAHNAYWVEVSFWTPAINNGNAYPAINIEFKDANGNTLAAHGVNPKVSADIEDGWIRASGNFEVAAECRVLRIYLEEYDEIVIDALLIRHTAADVYYTDPNGRIMMNNFPIGK